MNRLSMGLLCCGLAITPQAFADVTPATTLVANAKAQTQQVELEEFETMRARKDAVVIDVRTQQEFDAGHVPGAIWIPRGKLEFAVSQYANGADTPILLYCRSGSRSALANQTLRSMGYTQVVDLNGGFNAWSDYSAQKQAN